MRIAVPAHLLPLDAAARHARLREYFCDKDAIATLVGDRWHLELDWPAGTERHVDPRLERELLAWDGIGLAGMATARRRSGRVLTALYDTWTLPSWSAWVARARPHRGAVITILHLDDHRDLGSPRLAYEADGSLTDLIDHRPFDVRDPASVTSACETGAVGMGSFLTPFVLAFPNCDVRQLGQAPKVLATTDATIVPGTVEDDLLCPGAARPIVSLELADGPGPGRYRTTADVGDWLRGLPDGPVLLHIDMDFFNNRYDGDGDWPDRRLRHDPPLDEVLERIDLVTLAMREQGVLDRVVDAVVAFSPGFFPAEMWQPAELRLRTRLGELYD